MDGPRNTYCGLKICATMISCLMLVAGVVLMVVYLTPPISRPPSDNQPVSPPTSTPQWTSTVYRIQTPTSTPIETIIATPNC